MFQGPLGVGADKSCWPALLGDQDTIALLPLNLIVKSLPAISAAYQLRLYLLPYRRLARRWRVSGAFLSPWLPSSAQILGAASEKNVSHLAGA
jgi:hypothetical protein